MDHEKIGLAVSKLRSAMGLGALLLLATGCATGYMKTEDLQREGQGPAGCETRCRQLGMQMGALVLVSRALPACVCVPQQVQGPGPEAGAERSADPRVGGLTAGAVGGYVVIAQEEQRRQQQQQQQQQQQSTFQH